MKELYNMMFKRKSFRQFKSEKSISLEEIDLIKNYLKTKVQRFSPEEMIEFRIVPQNETTCKRGEYCILIYGNHNNRTLLEIGFVFGQLDFYLSSIDIGTCWYGMGKPLELTEIEKLPFVIMIAIGKAATKEFRLNYKTVRRKANEEFALGEFDSSFLEYIKYSPSACNSQPWLLCRDEKGFSIKIKYKDKMIIPKEKISFYNTIDMGIMLFSCEVWLKKNVIEFERTLSNLEETYRDGELVVKYELLQSFR